MPGSLSMGATSVSAQTGLGVWATIGGYNPAGPAPRREGDPGFDRLPEELKAGYYGDAAKWGEINRALARATLPLRMLLGPQQNVTADGGLLPAIPVLPLAMAMATAAGLQGLTRTGSEARTADPDNAPDCTTRQSKPKPQREWEDLPEASLEAKQGLCKLVEENLAMRPDRLVGYGAAGVVLGPFSVDDIPTKYRQAVSNYLAGRVVRDWVIKLVPVGDYGYDPKDRLREAKGIELAHESLKDVDGVKAPALGVFGSINLDHAALGYRFPEAFANSWYLADRSDNSDWRDKSPSQYDFFVMSYSPKKSLYHQKLRGALELWLAENPRHPKFAIIRSGARSDLRPDGIHEILQRIPELDTRAGIDRAVDKLFAIHQRCINPALEQLIRKGQRRLSEVGVRHDPETVNTLVSGHWGDVILEKDGSGSCPSRPVEIELIDFKYYPQPPSIALPR